MNFLKGASALGYLLASYLQSECGSKVKEMKTLFTNPPLELKTLWTEDNILDIVIGHIGSRQ